MAIVLKDRVQETTTITGTGDFVLGGAVFGFQAFSAIGNTNTTYYAAADPLTGAWEVGIGTYSTTGPTLTRTTVLSSSAAGAKVSFAAGSKTVFCTYPSEKAIYEETSGNVLIDGGPITVISASVPSYTTFSAALGELYGNVNSFAQFYAQNYNNGAEASGDFVVYRNDAVNDTGKFVDMGINSSNYASATYPIFSAGSAYTFNDGGEMFFGSATGDVVLFAGGVGLANEIARFKTGGNILLGSYSQADTGQKLQVYGTQKVTGAATFGSTVTLNADPSAALQAATKQYVDGAVATGFTVHTPVRLATIAALPTNTYNNGTSGVGATLTAVATGVLTVDGATAILNNRILVKNEAAPANNGVYDVTVAGAIGVAYVLTRVADFNQATAGEIANNAYFYVTAGSTLAGFSFVLSQLAAITVGTTALPFTEFASQLVYTGGTNINVTGQVISLTGTVAATNGGTGTGTVATGDLLYGSGTNTWGKLALGAAYKSLVVNGAGTQVEWNAVALNQSGAVSGALSVMNGGTGLTAYNIGELLYSNTTSTLAPVTRNITTTKLFLNQTGTGSAAGAPVWGQPAATDITGLAASATTDTTNAANITSGTLPSGRISGSYTGLTGTGALAAGSLAAGFTAVSAPLGGTGQSSYAVGDLLFSDTTTSLAKLADVAVGNALISGGVGSAPSYGKIGLATHVSGTLPVANGGTGVTSSTGTGSVVLSNSPTLVTPALGTPSSGTVTNLTGTASININGTVGATTPATASVTTLTASLDSSFTSTGALLISKGTTAQRTAGTAGQLRFNTTSTEFEGYNGTVWASVGGAALANDTTTSTDLFPLFASATTGTASTLKTSNAKLLYKPSTGELKASEVVSTNGISVNSTTVAASYTIASGQNALAVGPITIASGQTVTVSSGQRWVIL